MASQVAPKLSSRILASSGYTLDIDRFGPDAFSVWNERTAARQDKAWQPLVAAAKAGKPREDVAVLERLLRPILAAAPESTILEVGCGGGYISEILRTWFPDIHYTGVDISGAMVELARRHYPSREFRVGSAYELTDADDSVDIVVDGVALLHMPGWKTSLEEYTRVARTSIVLHGLTLTDEAETTRFAKYAYGQPSLELVFNRGELLGECGRLGLEVVETGSGLDYDLGEYIGIPSVSESWVLRVPAA
ncbi:class I SAM-dependent methyltransferase [Leifsonia poae]|uniref:class I SAM-dependent methyltransferase n=1 Tax=Leifsonia poae TaxID=110933 RepID=UPI001CBA7322|nr:class I SAM-dependent methyltransferase [Leifsonia poae]